MPDDREKDFAPRWLADRLRKTPDLAFKEFLQQFKAFLPGATSNRAKPSFTEGVKPESSA